MADEADLGSEREERDREIALKIARQQPTRLPSTGFCHWCEEKVKKGQIFCNTDCRDDSEKYDKLR